MNDTHRGLLLIADISGFTRFMRLHALATSHARQIVVRLLRALVDAAEPPLVVAELEGDAVFFYALATEPEELDRLARAVKRQVLRFYQVFEREIADLKRLTACVCGACTSVGQLQLKQVLHCGEVALERIDRFEKLFGLDVILVHRMLKNSVPAADYAMLTRPAYEAGGGFFDLTPEFRTEMFEGVGEVETLVFYQPEMAPLVAAVEDVQPAPSLWELCRWKLRMHAHTLGELLGLRRPETAGAPAV